MQGVGNYLKFHTVDQLWNYSWKMKYDLKFKHTFQCILKDESWQLTKCNRKLGDCTFTDYTQLGLLNLKQNMHDLKDQIWVQHLKVSRWFLICYLLYPLHVATHALSFLHTRLSEMHFYNSFASVQCICHSHT